jgi:hypothetical protein
MAEQSNARTEIQRAATFKVAADGARAALDAMRKKSVSDAFAIMAPVFQHFGVKVRRKKGRWLLEGGGRSALEVTDSGEVAHKEIR